MKNIYFLLIILTFSSQITFAHDGGHYSQENKKKWYIKAESISIVASYLMYKDGNVFFEDDKGKILKYSLQSLTKEDQTYILKKDQLISRINDEEANAFRATYLQYENNKVVGLCFSAGLVFLTGFIFLIFWNKRFKINFLEGWATVEV